MTSVTPCRCWSTGHDMDCPNHISHQMSAHQYTEVKIYAQSNIATTYAAGLCEGVQHGFRTAFAEFSYPEWGSADIRVCPDCKKPDVHWSVSSHLRCRDCRSKDRDEKLASHREFIRWTAQTVHQAYHQDMPGTWEECPRDVCSSAKKQLE